MTEIKIFGGTPAVAVRTDIGRKAKNEDSYTHFSVPGLNGSAALVLVVADGVTSTEGGGRASEIAVERMREYLNEGASRPLPNRMRDAIQRTNRDIYDQAEQNPAWKGMSTTIVLAAIAENQLYTAHLGDSRAYLLRDQEIHRLTIDHTWVQEAIDSGRITEAEALDHPNRHVIQRYLGIKRQVEVDVAMIDLGEQFTVGQQRRTVDQLTVRPGDVILLCSDGLYNSVQEHEIAMLVHKHSDVQRIANELVKLANDRGENDNITVLLAALPGGKRRIRGVTPAANWRTVVAALALLLIPVAIFLLLSRTPTEDNPAGTVVAVQPTAAVVATVNSATATIVSATATAAPPTLLPVTDQAVVSVQSPTASPSTVNVTSSSPVTITAPGASTPPTTASATTTRSGAVEGQNAVAQPSTPSTTSTRTPTSTAVRATSTPLASPTQTATATPAPATATPVPTRTSAASATQTVTPAGSTPPGTATGSTGTAVPFTGNASLVEPTNNDTFEGNVRVQFTWDVKNFSLPAGHGYELVFWTAGQNAQAGSSPLEASTATSVSVDLSRTRGDVLPRNQAVQWGVFLVQLPPDYKRLAQIGDVRTFRYNTGGGSDSGQGATQAPTSAPPSDADGK